MPRFYFNIFDKETFVDEFGSELPDHAAVRRQALRVANNVLRELSEKSWEGSEWRLTVTDTGGEAVLRLRFSAEEGIDGLGGPIAQIEPPSARGI